MSKNKSRFNLHRLLNRQQHQSGSSISAQQEANLPSGTDFALKPDSLNQHKHANDKLSENHNTGEPPVIIDDPDLVAPGDSSVDLSLRGRTSSAKTENNANEMTENTGLPTELECALDELKTTYAQFLSMTDLCGLDENDFLSAIKAASVEQDVKSSAAIFRNEIAGFLRIVEQKQVKRGKWADVLANFLSKFYQLTKTSLPIAGAIAEGANFMALKGATGALTCIMQIFENEKDRRGDFELLLRRSGYQAARVSENPYFYNASEAKKDCIRQKGVHLMVAIINLFSSALAYFSKPFAVNLIATISQGRQSYNDRKNLLLLAIDEYDQAVIDLTCSLVIGMELSQKEKHDEEFFGWLLPSYWPVESQRSAARRQRAKDTLQWLPRDAKLRDWLPSTDELCSTPQTLWIKGHPGVGKSIIAGYLIDFLQCQYPDSITLYFFCKRGNPQLTHARDIIRTISYQCVLNANIRPTLESLKKSGFRTDEKVGISFLFEMLLEKPLNCSTKQIFIILDGLDEADDMTQDDVEKKFEMEILIEHLSNLSSARTVFISRPVSNVVRFVPNAVSRSIDIEDNQEDIERYVKQVLTCSPTIEALFQRRGLDPVQYFRDRARGIFLWVSLVLKQLAAAPTLSACARYLDSLSHVPGDMDDLYRGVLSKFTPEERAWVGTTIRWILVAQRDLQIEELKTLVESSLRDEHVDFAQFLEIQCGSILRTVPAPNGSLAVQIIHETFRSFLVDDNMCPPGFRFCSQTAHGDLASICFASLSFQNAKSAPIRLYASEFWVTHLTNCSRSQLKLLQEKLHKFFKSVGVKTWVKLKLGRFSYTAYELKICTEEAHLEALTRWLSQSGISLELENVCTENQMADYIEWIRYVNEKPMILGEYIGKAATELWMYEDLNQHNQVEACFSLSLKYYQKRDNRSMTKFDELQNLIETEFKDMSAWVDRKDCALKARNVGVVFYLCGALDQCITWFTRTLQDDIDGFRDWEFLLKARQAKGYTMQVIEELEIAFEKAPTDYLGHLLANTYHRSSDADGMIRCYEKMLHCSTTVWRIWKSLGDAYKLKHNLTSAIKCYQTAIDQNPTASAGLWCDLAAAYDIEGDVERAYAAYRSAINLNIQNSELWRDFAEFSIRHNDHGAIQVYEWGVEKYPDFSCLWDSLADAYEANGDSGGALRTYERAVTINPNKWWYWMKLARKRKEKDGVEGAIEIYERAVKSNLGNETLWDFLANERQQKDGPQGAIEVYEAALRSCPSEHWDCEGLAEEYDVNSSLNRIYHNPTTIYPAKWWLLRGLGEIFEVRGNLNRSLKAYEMAMANIPPEELYNVEDVVPRCIGIYESRNNLAGALNLCCRMDKILSGLRDEEDLKWRLWFSAAFAFKTMSDAAIQVFQTAVKYNSTCPSLWKELGHALKRYGDLNGAIQTYREGIGENPTSPLLWDCLGEAYLEKGEVTNAIETYRNAIDKNLSNAYLPLRLGDIYFSQCEHKSAIDAYERASMNGGEEMMYVYACRGSISRRWDTQEIDSQLYSSFLWYNLHKAHIANGDFEAAIKPYDQAIVVYKTALRGSARRLEWIHHPGGVPNSGFNLFGILPDVVILCALGEIYRARGDMEKSTASFKRALASKPNNRWLQHVVSDISEEIVKDK